MSDARLLRALQHCSPNAQLLLLAQLLTRSGYENVRVEHLRPEQSRLPHAGFDLRCELPTALTTSRIIVKVVSSRIRLRHLAELESTTARVGADLGILVTLSGATSDAREHESYFRTRHVCLVAGRTLALLLREHRLGVTSKGEVDYAYLARLEDTAERLFTLEGGVPL